MHFHQDSALELHTLYMLPTLASLQFAEAQTREALGLEITLAESHATAACFSQQPRGMRELLEKGYGAKKAAVRYVNFHRSIQAQIGR